MTINVPIETYKRLIEAEKRYIELIMEVGKKYPGESRHETALRYIRIAETHTDSGAKTNGVLPPERKGWSE